MAFSIVQIVQICVKRRRGQVTPNKGSVVASIGSMVIKGNFGY